VGECKFNGYVNEPLIDGLTSPQVSQGLGGQYRDILNTYWQNQVTKLETEEHDYKLHQLPLARIKKVMKADPEVKMISAEAPILFAKGCDIFITELTMRAWIHAEENKRRTLQRSDIASALAKSDMFDFLIDIVPREDATPQHKRRPDYTPVGTYQVPDAGAGGPANSAALVGGQEPPPMAPQEFAGMEQQHLPQQPQYQQQTGMYPPPAPQQQYSGQPMFDPNMYTAQQPAYGMGQMPQMAPQVSSACLLLSFVDLCTDIVEQMYPSAQQQQHQGRPTQSNSDRHCTDNDAEGEQDYGGNG
jgi:nuclear transcription factor Y, gamma